MLIFEAVKSSLEGSAARAGRELLRFLEVEVSRVKISRSPKLPESKCLISRVRLEPRNNR